MEWSSPWYLREKDPKDEGIEPMSFLFESLHHVLDWKKRVWLYIFTHQTKEVVGRKSEILL